MKQWLIILIGAIGMLSQSAVAQSQTSRLTEEQKEELIKEMEAYMEEMNLTEDQEEKYKEISLKYLDEFKGLRESNDSKLGKYRKAKDLQEKKNKEMRDLLDDRQYKLYLEKQEERREKMKERRKSNK